MNSPNNVVDEVAGGSESDIAITDTPLGGITSTAG